jgi:hypothetical protein
MEGITRKDGGDVNDLGPWRYIRVITDEGKQMTLTDPKFRKSFGADAIVGYRVRSNELHIIHVSRVKKIVELRESKMYGDLIEVEIEN